MTFAEILATTILLFLLAMCVYGTAIVYRANSQVNDES